ncbi:SGNH/GDSL hydrolase family protein [Sphingomonas sp.]|uniref:SGNH/GDSL hydrolase family protein n=1 Tax=Sphingomonas sp. TaxID=28214 RepID=UPI001EBCE842|nr:SGNH/GDSL hydrolase family protein [Sphingomonas sp.]MBX3594811.1 SGNH/GDSL hydrolase family protein [Sphingomonas sp.]
MQVRRWAQASFAGIFILVTAMTAGPATVAKEAPPAARNPWVGAWGYAASPATETPGPTRPAGTFRYRIRLTQGGAGVALRFTNPENAVPLVISGASVAIAAPRGFAGIAAPMAAGFAGKAGVTVEAGASISTDPIRLPVTSGQDVIVTLTTAAPSTDVAGSAGFVTEFTPAAPAAPAEATRARPFVSLVSVHNPRAPCTIVTLGDSITEGARGKDASWRGWPGRFARRLIEASPQSHCGVVNMGIGGNRLLAYGRGPSGIERFGRDVLAVPGVTHVVLLEGINDIVRSASPRERAIGSAQLIAGYRQIIEMAHKRGIRVIGGTMTPAWGSRFITPELERIRRETNRWIVEPGNFDASIDFESALADGTTPPALKPAFDSGDHLHPADDGYAAMAASVPLNLFAASVPMSGAKPE